MRYLLLATLANAILFAVLVLAIGSWPLATVVSSVVGAWLGVLAGLVPDEVRA